MYTINMSVPADGGDWSVEFDLDDAGLPVPRVGETLIFDPGEVSFELVVTGVLHWFPTRQLVLNTRPPPGTEQRVAAALESGKIVAMLQALPMVQNLWFPEELNHQCRGLCPTDTEGGTET